MEALNKALREKGATIILIFGLTVLLILILTGLYQINEMMMVIATYEKLVEWIWIPQLGLSALHCFMMFWMMILLGIVGIIILLLWYFAQGQGKSYFSE